jgi:hypothetical protein
MEQWCYTQKTGFYFYGSDIDLLKSEFKILPNTIKKYEAEIGSTYYNGIFRRRFRTYKIVFSETFKLTVLCVKILYWNTKTPIYMRRVLKSSRYSVLVTRTS